MSAARVTAAGSVGKFVSCRNLQCGVETCSPVLDHVDTLGSDVFDVESDLDVSDIMFHIISFTYGSVIGGAFGYNEPISELFRQLSYVSKSLQRLCLSYVQQTPLDFFWGADGVRSFSVTQGSVTATSLPSQDARWTYRSFRATRCRLAACWATPEKPRRFLSTSATETTMETVFSG